MENSELIEILLKVTKTFLFPIIFAVVCGAVVGLQAQKRFQRREFLDQLNFSLNIIKDGRLRIRTLIEKPCGDVFQNPAITKLVRKKARQTTAQDCLLPIDKDDYWLCLNAILNEVSQRFADGFLMLDALERCHSETYVMCITSEVADNIKTRKIRVMLTRKSLLENFPTEDPQIDFASHSTRIVTLRQLARDYCSGEKAHCFVEIELCFGPNQRS